MPDPFITLQRRAWAELANHTQIDLDEGTLDRLRGIGDPTNQIDVAEVHRPLTQLIHLHMVNTGRLYRQSNEFLGIHTCRTPFVIGVAGSVAVGKSTVSRLLQELLRRAPGSPKVDLVTTDGFLYPNKELQRRGLLDRKGFPESYDRIALMNFVMAVKAGEEKVTAPVYSHMTYDITEDRITVESPDILIIEGLNVLQPARADQETGVALAVSDFFDFTVFVDAEEELIKGWFLNRFMHLRATAFTDERSYFRRYTDYTDEDAIELAGQIWDSVNGPNLRQNIAPTRDRATAILVKGPDHSIESIKIRKL